jgi:hypothetical protein
MHPDQRPDPDGSPESLEARLRALPQPSVPADLEARLLSAIPTELPFQRRRWAVWVGVVGPLAAACLLAVFAWPRGDGNHPVPNPPTKESAHQVTPRPPDDPDSIAAWWEARRVLDGAERLTFIWPLPETSSIKVSTPIPPDLLD